MRRPDAPRRRVRNPGKLESGLLIAVVIMAAGLYALHVHQLRYVGATVQGSIRTGVAPWYLELAAHAFTDAESCGRAYLLTRDDRYLLLFQSNVKESRRILNLYEESAFEAGTPAPEIRRVDANAEAALQALGGTVEAYQKYGREAAVKHMRAAPGDFVSGDATGSSELRKRQEEMCSNRRAMAAELNRRIATSYWIGGATLTFIVAVLIVTLSVVFDKQKRLADDIAERENSYRTLVVRMERVREDERARLAREIHDELGQSLTALKITLGSIARRLHKTNDRPALESIADAAGMADDTIRNLQRIATELRPAILDQLGLVAAIEWQAREFKALSGIEVTARLPDKEVPLTSEARISLYRILQESLTNVARHAHARHVNITLLAGGGRLLLEIADDGVGFLQDGHEAASLGIAGMRERAHLIDAEMTLRTEAGAGTTVSVQLPKFATPAESLQV